LASTASVADSEIADTRADTLLGMGSIVPSANGAGRGIKVQSGTGQRTTVQFDSGG